MVRLGVLVDRSQGGIDFGVPPFSCYQTSMLNYTPEDCPFVRLESL